MSARAATRRGVLVQPPHRLRHGKPRKRRSSQAASQRRRTKCSEDGSGRRLGHDDRPESLAGGLRRGSGLAGSWARRGESAARRWPSYEECDAERAGGGGGRRWGRSNGRGGVYGRTRTPTGTNGGRAGGRRPLLLRFDAAGTRCFLRWDGQPRTFYIAAFFPPPNAPIGQQET
jgi:hypothetical protein